MNVIDLLVIVVLLTCLWRGWRTGILVQLSGIIGIVLGAWIAFAFSAQIGLWLGIGDLLPRGILHAVVFVAVLWGVVWACRLLTRTLKAGGLAAPLRLLGAVFAVGKGLLFMGLLLVAAGAVAPWLDSVRAARQWKEGRSQEQTETTDSKLQTLVQDSKSYEYIKEVGEYVFPYLADGAQALAREFTAGDTLLVAPEPIVIIDTLPLSDPVYRAALEQEMDSVAALPQDPRDLLQGFDRSAADTKTRKK